MTAAPPAPATPEYPSVFHAADRAAISRQREFVWMMRSQLGLLFVVTVVTSVSSAGLFTDPATGKDHISGVLSIIGASLMLLTLVLSFFMRYNNPDERWFQCRALAENTKSLAWRFAMGMALPGVGTAEERFVNAVAAMRRRLPRTQNCLAQEGVGTAWVTPWMRSTRAASIADRLAALRHHRVLDQCEWYDRKSKFNASRDALFYGFVFVFEVLALGFSVWLVVRQVAKVEVDAVYQLGYPAMFAAAAASLLAWMQFRKYGDLISTYSVAADDLRLVDTAADSLALRLPSMTPEAAADEFAGVVERAEAAISREHSMWLGPMGA